MAVAAGKRGVAVSRLAVAAALKGMEASRIAGGAATERIWAAGRVGASAALWVPPFPGLRWEAGFAFHPFLAGVTGASARWTHSSPQRVPESALSSLLEMATMKHWAHLSPPRVLGLEFFARPSFLPELALTAPWGYPSPRRVLEQRIFVPLSFPLGKKLVPVVL